MLRLSQLWSFLSFFWSLDPDGGPRPTAADSGDTGSILEPNG
jgi:hypothetical protein